MKIHWVDSLLLFLMFIMLPVACSTPVELEGTWCGYEMGGPWRDWTLTIGRSQFRLVCENEPIWYRGILKLNGNCTRKKMDLIITDSQIRNYRGLTSLGVYDIEDGSLLLFTSKPGISQRPLAFDNNEEVIAFVFEKNQGY